MPQFINVNFDSATNNRFNNTIVGGPIITNNLVAIEPIEFFDGDSSGLFENSFLESASHANFIFGPTRKLFIQLRFMILRHNTYGIVGRRQDQNNRWHISLDSLNSQLFFFANDAAAIAHNVTISFTPQITLGRWHTLEMATDGNVVRFFIDGQFIGKSTDAGSLTVDSGGSATLRIGQVNTAIVSSPSVFVHFSGFMDSIIFDTDHTFSADINHPVRVWTGGTEKLHTFTTPLVPHPSIIDRSFPNNIPSFAIGNNQLYIVGIDEPKKVDESVVVSIGITKPSNAPTISGTTGANYEYVIVFVDNRGNESPPSPRSTILSLTTGTVTRNNTPPSNAKTWRVYRRFVSAGQANHYLVKEDLGTGNFGTTNTLTWVDNVASGSESLFKTAPSRSSFTAPQSNFAVFNGSRMFYMYPKLIDATIHPTRVYYSPPNNLDIIEKESSWFFVGTDDSHPISAGALYKNIVVVFKDNAMHGVLGDPQLPDFTIVDISLSVGCVAHLTVKSIDSRLMWLGQDGFYLYNGGSEPILISDDINEIISEIPDNLKPFASSSIDQEFGLYLTSIGTKILCYHYRESLKDNIHRWTVWNVTDTVLSEGRAQGTLKYISYFADNNGKMGSFSIGLDLNSGINPVWQTPFLSTLAGVRGQRITVSTFIVESEGFENKVFEVGFDVGKGEQLLEFINPSSLNLKFRVGQRCEFISYIFTGIDLRDPFKILGIQIDGQPIGFR